MTFLEFPKDFEWGASTSAYQIEGAWNKDGKGESIWDRFTHRPYNIINGDTGDNACNHYEHMEDDVQLIKQLGLKTYSFSISWPRVMPKGQGAPNPNGIDFYDRLVDALLEAGVNPNATLNHWNYPQALLERGGWPNRDSVDWFVDYAQLMFETFGDRVTQWTTHNEPWVVGFLGYGIGIHAPGIHDYSKAYQAIHHLLVSHGKAVQMFRQGGYKGEIGIVFNFDLFRPSSDSPADVAACQRSYEENISLFLEPVFEGKYPELLIDWVGSHTPKIQEGDMEIIQEPNDFLGINYYKAFLVSHDIGAGILKARWDPLSDSGWGRNQMGWGIHPSGMVEVLSDVKAKAGDLPLYITENGVPFPDEPDEDDFVADHGRVNFLREHLRTAHQAIEQGINLKGYFAWSLMDNFEWAMGYGPRFGLVRVDFETEKRTPKESAHWYSQVIEANGLHV